jgi:hypothetical protein
MKKLLTFTLATTLSIGFAFANNSKPANVSTPNSSLSATSLATLLEVARENQQLREALLALENESAELKSQLSYQQMMGNMLTTLRTKENKEALAETQATIQYVTTMTQVMQALQAKNTEEQVAELKALAEYEKTMAAIMSHLKATAVK